MRKVHQLPVINNRPTQKELLAILEEIKSYPEEVMVVSARHVKKLTNAKHHKENIT